MSFDENFEGVRGEIVAGRQVFEGVPVADMTETIDTLKERAAHVAGMLAEATDDLATMYAHLLPKLGATSLLAETNTEAGRQHFEAAIEGSNLPEAETIRANAMLAEVSAKEVTQHSTAAGEVVDNLGLLLSSAYLHVNTLKSVLDAARQSNASLGVSTQSAVQASNDFEERL